MNKNKKIIFYNSINKPFVKTAVDPINLGLLALSSILKKNGYQVVLIPNIDTPGSIDLLKKELIGCELVGVSCMTGDPILNGLKFSKIVKSINAKIPICWGGYHATIDYVNTIKNKYIDFVIRGQGEETIIELLSAINNNFDLSKIPGLVYKKNHHIIFNKNKEIQPIDKYPFFDYNLYFDRYSNSADANIIYCSSRGCPFECTFCSVSNFYKKKYLFYSDKRFLSDIDTIVKKYHPQSIFFWDDNFFVNINRVNLFMRHYIKKKYKFKWSAFSRCNTFSKDNSTLMNLLKKTHCTRILFGAESGSPRVLNFIKKNIEIDDIVNSCKVLLKYKIDPDYTFITGFPTETISDLMMTISLIRKINNINPKSGVRLFSFCPTPGIPILTDCFKVGFKLPKKIEKWSKYEYHSFIAPWVSKKHQNLIKILVWITSFASDNTKPKTGHFLFDLIFLIMNFDAKLRIKYNIFIFPYEWRLLYLIYKCHYSK